MFWREALEDAAVVIGALTVIVGGFVALYRSRLGTPLRWLTRSSTGALSAMIRREVREAVAPELNRLDAKLDRFMAENEQQHGEARKLINKLGDRMDMIEEVVDTLVTRVHDLDGKD